MIGDVRNCLTRLIDQAVTMIARPHSIYLDVDRDAARDLLELTLQIYGRPAPDGRYIDDEQVLLAECLVKIVDRGGNGRAAVLYQIVGVLLPCTRAALSRAIDAQKNPPRD